MLRAGEGGMYLWVQVVNEASARWRGSLKRVGHATYEEQYPRQRVDYNYRKERAEIKQQTKLKYVENIQGTFFDHVMTDPQKF